MPAAGPVTRWDADRSTPARWQYSSTTREPRSSPSKVDRPALAPIRLAALAAVTAPPQETANSSAKISSPGAGRDGTSPKTISRNIVPNAIRSMALAPVARGPGWQPVPCGRRPSPECLGRGVGPGDVAGGAVPGDQFPQGRRDLVALIDGERAPPPEAAAGGGVDHPRRLTHVGLLRDVEQADPDGHVQHRNRLVGQDQLGPHGQGLGETDPLPLAAAELVRVALHDLGGGGQ